MLTIESVNTEQAGNGDGERERIREGGVKCGKTQKGRKSWGKE